MGRAMSLLDVASASFGSICDSKTNHMSAPALNNINGHYPAGGS